MKRMACLLCLLASFLSLTKAAAAPLLPLSLSPSLPLSPAPPAAPVKLIFVHHSTGGNWLADPNEDQPAGGLALALMENNYFVSATNYGWGPDGIGDRTDIPNWPEWFVGPNRDTYLDALYNESDQNVGDFGDWSRLTDDPGGENVIIMFKSCFPNSDLYGNPDDPPLAEPNDYDYTVANAKAVYNALLTYFETRQDKLFVVITAPPLMESDTSRDRAANARAFNNWLVNDWLTGYPYANVAVFDYFNVLTAPDNHHRWNGSTIEHIQATNNNYSAYPSGDSHPSTEGHSKATAEFAPLLNVAYNRWQAAGVVSPPPVEKTTTTPSDTEPPPAKVTEAPAEIAIPLVVGAAGVIDGLEGDFVWHADPGDGATFECNPDSDAHSGATALRITYAIPEGSWGACGRNFDNVQDWSDAAGLTLWLRTDTPGAWVTLGLFSGDPEASTPFEFGFEVTTDWNSIFIPWSDFARASWADESGLAELDPARIVGVAFSFGEGKGSVWVDELATFTEETPALEPTAPPATEKPPVEKPVTPEPTVAEASDTAEEGGAGGGLCGSAPLALSLLAVAMVIRRRESRL
ncbi:MAG TPA: CIA30 family protein [Anaerolineae bacterium]|nr:CIA30 family protein [Anaerolineae bacterium]